MADFAQAVEALTDAPQPVLQLHVPGAQHLRLHAAHVLRADGVLLNLCGDKQSAMRKDLCPEGVGTPGPELAPAKVQTQEPAAAPSVLTLGVGKHRFGGKAQIWGGPQFKQRCHQRSHQSKLHICGRRPVVTKEVT